MACDVAFVGADGGTADDDMLSFELCNNSIDCSYSLISAEYEWWCCDNDDLGSCTHELAALLQLLKLNVLLFFFALDV